MIPTTVSGQIVTVSVSTRLPYDVCEKLKARATQENKNVSRLLAAWVTEKLESEVKQNGNK